MSIYDFTESPSPLSIGLPDELSPAGQALIEAGMNQAFGPAGWTDESIDEYEIYLANHPEEMDRCLLDELHVRFLEADARLVARLEEDRRQNAAWAEKLSAFGGERGVA